MSRAAGLRLYNLFPRLAGNMARWLTHLDRIERMAFDWVYVNPWHYAGYSGSLYSVKDPYRYADLFLDGDEPGDIQLKRFIDAAHERGLRVMMDLVINHTAFDAELVTRHPEWYEHEPDGSITHPGTLDNGAWVTWGDLAQLDHLGPHHQALWDYWRSLASHYLDLGIDGLRCDAAYHVPLPVWQWLLPAIREQHPDTVFLAETLGCPANEIVSLADAGFDGVFNSSKWWDFRAEWFLKEYRKWSGCAPSVAFPESHDTPRLASELGQNADAIRQRYLFAALVSAGVMMPIGFEYGFLKPLDVVKTVPYDWEEPSLDLTEFIGAANRLKLEHPVFQLEGDLVQLDTGNRAALALVKQTFDKRHKALLLINSDHASWQRALLPKIADEMGVARLLDCSLGHRMEVIPENLVYELRPSEIKVFVGVSEAPRSHRAIREALIT